MTQRLAHGTEIMNPVLVPSGAYVDFDQNGSGRLPHNKKLREAYMRNSADRKLLAVVYDDGIAADRMLSELGYTLREKRVNVMGLVQRNTFIRDREKCDMELEELGSGEIFQLSQDRGKFAGGCRLDREAIASAAALMEGRLREGCDLLIVNKFGRSEAEGCGLRDVIAQAVTQEIPTVVGVPRRNLEVWLKFAAGLFDLCDTANGEAMLSWIASRAGWDVALRLRIARSLGRDETKPVFA